MHDRSGEALRAVIDAFDDEVDPGDPARQAYLAQAHHFLGWALFEAGNAQDAIPHYRRALELVSDYPKVHYNLFLSYKRLGRDVEASQSLQQSRTLCEARLKIDADDARAHWQLAFVEMAAGKPDAALRSLRRAVELRPCHVQLLHSESREGRAFYPLLEASEHRDDFISLMEIPIPQDSSFFNILLDEDLPRIAPSRHNFQSI